MICRIAVTLVWVATIALSGHAQQGGDGTAGPATEGTGNRPAPPSVPEKAFVQTKVALARVGPGMEHYPTDALTMGESVEVIERRDGWVAVRPPQNAFGWIEADRLQPVDAPYADVVSDDTPVWVGSSVTAVDSHDCQVRLRRGERVEILAEKSVVRPNGQSATWLKVAPPVGERRWVKADELGDQRPALAAPDEPSRVAARPSEDTGESPGRSIESEPERSVTGPATRERRASSEVAASETHSRPGQARVRRETHDSLVWVERGSSSPVPPDGDPFEVSESDPAIDLRTFEDHCTFLQLKIARAAARAASLGSLRTLRRNVDELTRNAAGGDEQRKAKELAESINALIALAERRAESIEPAGYSADGFAQRGPASRDDDRLIASRGNGSTESSTAPDPASYAATGWLMPVSGSSRKSPPFVLMDRDGHPIAFVTPVPGLNLRRYVDEEIGIVGETTFPVLDRKHVVAHRAVKIARHRDAPAETARPSAPWIRFRQARIP